jgi:glucokinase
MLLLVGDIGGTNTRLRLIEVATTVKSFKAIKTIREKKYPSTEFPDLVPIVQQFLTTVEETTPKAACFAIAGPVVNNTSNLTNLNWKLDGERLERELNIENVSLINDFAANSYGILGLTQSDLLTLQSAEVNYDAPIAVLGAGTGLGESFLIPQGDSYQVFATEGGHTDFAPRNELETKLLQYLQNKFDLERVSVERVVSGQGIVAIYQFLRDSNFASESAEIGAKIKSWEEQKDTSIDPGAVISQAALDKSDYLCEKTMEMFVEAYGAEVGNFALKLLPYGGIYIAGGIAAKILPLMKDGRFLAAFKQKGRVSPLLNNIPVHIVLNAQLGLLGSVLYALKFNKQEH